jgi:hypothetical protein
MKRSQELTDRIKDTLEFDEEDFEEIPFQEEQDSLDYIKDRSIDIDIRSLNILPNNYSVEKIQRDFDEEDGLVYEDIEFKESFIEKVGEYKWDKLAKSIVERVKGLGSEEVMLSGRGRFLSFQFPKNRSTAIENWYKNELGFDPSKIEVL